MASGSQRVEVVRGSRDAALAKRLIAFWDAQAGLGGSEARRRLDEVLCVRLDADGEIVGVNSAYPATAPLVGARFWLYRRLLAPEADERAEAEMLEAARAELAAHFTGGRGEPLGLCLLVSDPAIIDRWPEAVWTAGDLMFAGYTERGDQVRISYFAGARIDSSIPPR